MPSFVFVVLACNRYVVVVIVCCCGCCCRCCLCCCALLSLLLCCCVLLYVVVVAVVVVVVRCCCCCGCYRCCLCCCALLYFVAVVVVVTVIVVVCVVVRCCIWLLLLLWLLLSLLFVPSSCRVFRSVFAAVVPFLHLFVFAPRACACVGIAVSFGRCSSANTLRSVRVLTFRLAPILFSSFVCLPFACPTAVAGERPRRRNASRGGRLRLGPPPDSPQPGGTPGGRLMRDTAAAATAATNRCVWFLDIRGAPTSSWLFWFSLVSSRRFAANDVRSFFYRFVLVVLLCFAIASARVQKKRSPGRPVFFSLPPAVYGHTTAAIHDMEYSPPAL